MPEFIRRVLAATVAYMMMANYWTSGKLERLCVGESMESRRSISLIILHRTTQVHCLVSLSRFVAARQLTKPVASREIQQWGQKSSTKIELRSKEPAMHVHHLLGRSSARVIIGYESPLERWCIATIVRGPLARATGVLSSRKVAR